MLPGLYLANNGIIAKITVATYQIRALFITQGVQYAIQPWLGMVGGRVVLPAVTSTASSKRRLPIQ